MEHQNAVNNAENNAVNNVVNNIDDVVLEGMRMNEQDMVVESSIDAIPDTKILLTAIRDMLTYISTKEMVNMRKKDKKKFEVNVSRKYQNIIPLRIINMMLDEKRCNENLEELLDMCRDLDQIKRGEISISDATKRFSEKKNEKYIYSKYGGKEGFEQHMAELNKKDK